MKQRKGIIPFSCVERENKFLKSRLLKAFKESINSKYILGQEVTDFENKFASHIGSKYACGVGNGHDGLLIALKALNITFGDEVLVPTNSFLASALAVSNANAKPVFIDCKADSTYRLSLESAKKKLTKNTKAIMPVHLYGMPADMDPILKFANENNLYVIEDCAQAHGATYKNKSVGTFGDMGVFSFYPTKNLGALGDGGCVTTNNKKNIDLVRKLSNYGKCNKFDINVQGLNSRLDTIQAKFLTIKLEHLTEWNKIRIMIAKCYQKKIKNKDVLLPKNVRECISVWHLFPIQYTGNNLSEFKEYLYKHKITIGFHYPIPIHKLSLYDEGIKLNNSEKFSGNLISLPIHQFMKVEEVEFIIDKINEFN